MQMWLARLTGIPDFADLLAPRHAVSALHQDAALAQVGQQDGKVSTADENMVTFKARYVRLRNDHIRHTVPGLQNGP